MSALPATCHAAVCLAIDNAGGWLRFDDFLNIALHDAHHGYYGSGRVALGGGGDFYTAALLSPLFAEVLGRQLLPYVQNGGAVLELGAGDGTLCEQLLQHLPPATCYYIVETSAALAARQRERLAATQQVQWLTALPEQHNGAIIANEVLDCVPFRLLVRQQGQWGERGVVREDGGLAFAVRPVSDDAADYVRTLDLPDGYACEVSPQAAALTASLIHCLQNGLLLFADYGYGAREYYHPQRSAGTMTCFWQQRTDSNPLVNVGEKDITAHVNFTAVAEAGIAAGARLAGYVTQAQGLINGGITECLSAVAPDTASYARLVSGAHKLLAPHEMGEIIKWLGFVCGDAPAAAVFSAGDIGHRL